MKTAYTFIMKALPVLLTALCWTSCSDFLEEDPKGQLPSDTYFSNKEDLDASLTALYSVIASSQASNNLCGTNFLVGDDISTHPSSNKQPLREHDQFDVKDNNSWLSSMWEQRFKVIKAANFIINNAERTPEVSKDDIKVAIAQAHYWRAYSYFYLVTTWGRVPIMLKEEIDYNAPLKTEEEVYELILSDLKIAETDCPALYTKEPYGRNGMNIAVSEGAVKATMAYVYMCMAGWPLNKGVEYYKLAAAKAKEVIDGADGGSYYYKLLPEYSQVYSWEYNNKNTELLLGIYYNRDATGQSAPLTDFLQDMKQAGWGDTNGEINFWMNFPEGPRKDATYFPKIMLSDGKLYDWWYDTDPASRGTEFDYTNPAVVNASGEKTFQLLRLSQVYCWYAEATGRAGEINEQAVKVLNEVRNRADGEKTNRYTTDMYKDHFEFRKKNEPIEVVSGVFRKEAVTVTGTWDDSKMYVPYPYEDVILNPNLDNSWKNR